MHRCAYCHGRFGLVRYRHFGRQFCSDRTRNRCQQRYLADHARQLSIRIGQFCPNLANLFRQMLSKRRSIALDAAVRVTKLR